MKNSIVRSVEALHEEMTIELVRMALERGYPAIEVIRWMQQGMEKVGLKYENGEYFIGDLIFAGILLDEVLNLPEWLQAYAQSMGSASEKKYEGKILAFSVYGCCHNLGKNIFVSYAKAAGFNVKDLGQDVPLEVVLDELDRFRPDIIGMSGMLSETAEEMNRVIKTLEERGIRSRYRIILGGEAVSNHDGLHIQADAATQDVVEGVEICKKWMQEKESQRKVSGM
ncbi:MAG: cobalamin-dependent protein [Eubacterium aggregans]|uniref:Methanogenic corrinoid protein MtbC1 n=1 Tax=Eubacterium aggregans TaxID=81409 RepID=A0A1H3ZB76_9FIRM|nr:cobalamin-dependent protein [Eubacterium aggregans]MEA5072913.1 cobalamin-dependent protein [Eubacterium aggregans]SEA20611.1 Methanogenic corrinoid protein MtbC1 [Eubacterium aggregans]